MYYWKIWRETRVLFFALLILGSCVGFATWARVAPLIIGGELASRIWATGMEQTLTVGGAVLYFLGLMIGSAGLGEEMERGTAVFLLTRPRSRGYFVWSFWAACCFELLAFTTITLLAGYGTLFYLTRRAGPWSFLLLGPTILITGLLAVGLAFLLTIGSRRAKNAVAGGLAFSFTYLVAAFMCALMGKWHIVHIVLPTPLSMYSLDWRARLVGTAMYSLNLNAGLAGTMLGWLAVSVAFVAIAHLMVTRMDV
jgi:ABC-type transport system involved in multi-copper enzyme maturation permease subunit